MKVDTCNYVHFDLADVNNCFCPAAKTSQMFSNDLTPKQASDLHQEIHRIAVYLNKLADRMAELQFAPEDQLLQLVQAAERSMRGWLRKRSKFGHDCIRTEASGQCTASCWRRLIQYRELLAAAWGTENDGSQPHCCYLPSWEQVGGTNTMLHSRRSFS